MNIWFNFVQWNIGPVISSKLFFSFSRVIYMVISSLHYIWIYTVYCFCRCNFITFLFPSLIFRNQVFYITPISYSMQAEIRPMRAVNANWNNIISIVNLLIFSHSFTDIISYQMAFYSTSSTVQKLIMAMISFPRNLYVSCCLATVELVRQYDAALLQWNLSSSNVHCPSLKYWVPSGQCWMTSWPWTHQMYLLQRDLCGKYTPFRFGLHGKSGSMKK